MVAIHKRCCIPGADGAHRCPKGHCGCRSTWTGCIAAYVVSSAAFLTLSRLGSVLTAEPQHSPGLDWANYWTDEEIGTGVHNGRVSSGALMLYTLALPLLLLGLSTCGAQAKDVQQLEEEKVPFRGWAPTVYMVVFSWSGAIMFILKMYTAQLRPIGLAKCADVLEEHVPGFNKTNDYTASLEQLRTCRSWEVEYFLGFPSGHASMAFAGVFGTGLMYFYHEWLLDGLVNALCCCNNQFFLRLSSRAKAGLRIILLIVSTIGAALIAASRVMDGSHFPVQVTAGSLIGISSSVLLVTSPLVKSGPLGGGARRTDKIAKAAVHAEEGA